MRLINCGGKLVFTTKWTIQYYDMKNNLYIVDVCDEDAKLLDKSYNNMPIEFEHVGDKAKIFFDPIK